jgi:hypothetical protein
MRPTIIEVEQPAQPFSTSDGAIALLTVISR